MSNLQILQGYAKLSFNGRTIIPFGYFVELSAFLISCIEYRRWLRSIQRL